MILLIFRRNRLTCTMWNHYADQVTAYLGDGRPGRIVLIIQFGKVKE